MTGSAHLDAADEETPRPLRRDAARNRAMLLAAGREIFAERGLDATLDDVAHRAGVGVGTAYRHFANKHELAKAIFADEVDRIVGLATAAADEPDPWTGLCRFVEGAAVAQTKDRGLREVLMGVRDDGLTERINDALTGSLRRIVTAGKAAGQLRDDAEPSDIGVVVMMLCTVTDVFGDHSAELWRRYLPMLLDGLKPGAALPVAALNDDDTRQAFANHKLRPTHR